MVTTVRSLNLLWSRDFFRLGSSGPNLAALTDKPMPES